MFSEIYVIMINYQNFGNKVVCKKAFNFNY
jgi:hypothetical protein